MWKPPASRQHENHRQLPKFDTFDYFNFVGPQLIKKIDSHLALSNNKRVQL